MRISDWSSDVCSSDLSLMMLAGYGGMVSLAQLTVAGFAGYLVAILGDNSVGVMGLGWPWWVTVPVAILGAALFGTLIRSEEHTSELQSLMRISYAVCCLKKKKNRHSKHTTYHV